MMLANQLKRLTPAHIRAWAAAAQPGARLIYAVGGNAYRDAGALVATAVVAFFGGGYLTINRAPRSAADAAGGFGFDYVAYRTEKPWPAKLERGLLDELEAIEAAA